VNPFLQKKDSHIAEGPLGSLRGPEANGPSKNPNGVICVMYKNAFLLLHRPALAMNQMEMTCGYFGRQDSPVKGYTMHI
jgi:hypothetical protein